MGKKSLKKCMQELTPRIDELHDMVLDMVKKHPELFTDVADTNSQVTGFMLTIGFEKQNNKVDTLSLDATLGYSGHANVCYTRDWQGKNEIKELKND